MAFAETEISRDLGEPIDLYLFRYGSTGSAVMGFTDADEDQEFEVPIDGEMMSVTFKAIPVDRSAVSTSGTLDKATLQISTSDDSPLADLFRLYPPSHVVTVTIWQGHANDPSKQYLAHWSGRVVAFNTEDDEARFTCDPISTSLKRPGLRRNWQYSCPHWLYGPKCKASKAAATEIHVVTGVAGASIWLDPNWSVRREKFHGGLAEWTLADGRLEVRTILRTFEDGGILLAGDASTLIPGIAVSVCLGCNHQAGVGPQPDGDCLPLHNNILNFGGQPWIPSKVPTGIQNIYY